MLESIGSARPGGGAPDDEPEMSLRARLLLCAMAWAAGLIVTLLMVLPAPMGVVLLPFFPEGLFPFLPRRVAGVVGWLTYLILTTFLLRSRTRTRFFVLFAVLCALLAVNAPGCKRIADKKNLGHSI